MDIGTASLNNLESMDGVLDGTLRGCCKDSRESLEYVVIHRSITTME